MSQTSDECPFCGNPIDKITKKCSICKRDIVEFNLSRISAKIELYGNGMSMHAGITVALSFGIFSVIQLLWMDKLSTLGYWLYFAVLIGFEALGYYTLDRFLNYRTAQIKNEFLLKELYYLTISPNKQDKD
jgi:hypothetical protein